MTLRKSRRLLLPVLLTLAGLLLTFAPAQGYVIIFKDGFVLQGKIKQQFTTIVDPVAGRGFTVPLGGIPYWLETTTSTITFSPSQVYDVVDDPPSSMPKWMHLQLYGFTGGTPLQPSWNYAKVGPFNDKWEREVSVFFPLPQPHHTTMTQRVTDLTPKFIRVRAKERSWASFYHPDEFGPEVVRKLLQDELAKDKNKGISELDRCVATAQFLAQCGWIEEAEKELKDFPPSESAKSKIESELAALTRVKTLRLVADLELAAKLGRWQEVQEKLAIYDREKLEQLVSAEADLDVFRIKDKLGYLKKRIVVAQQQLLTLPQEVPNSLKGFFTDASGTILKELNADTLPRLQTFLDQAEIYQQDIKAKRNPSYTAEEILSFAVTGWLLGSDIAEEDVEVAEKLWQARDFVLQYQNTFNSLVRKNLRDDFARNNSVDLDLMARLITSLPPPRPHAKINTDAQEIHFTPPEGGPGGAYAVQLPPEYNHQRAHPVLIVLADQGQHPANMLQQWSKLAAKYGYILAAPAWSKGSGYQYSADEQLFMQNLLRDLRSRFQVNSDRVFLFGLGQGGQMAYDVGLSQPDQFAGVLPMAAYPKYFCWNYRTNAQYLPFYVVDGALNTYSKIENDELFKNWIQWRYPALLVQYKGRGMEWLGGELPSMMDWMNRKKRFFPINQVGSVGSGNRKGEEFCTLRQSDCRFYWLSTQPNAIQRLAPAPGKVKWEKKWDPATLAATIHSGNQIYIYTKGLSHVSVWLAPGMIDFTKKVEVRVNGSLLGKVDVTPDLETMMENFWEQGDRSRLYLARIPINFK